MIQQHGRNDKGPTRTLGIRPLSRDAESTVCIIYKEIMATGTQGRGLSSSQLHARATNLDTKPNFSLVFGPDTFWY